MSEAIENGRAVLSAQGEARRADILKSLDAAMRRRQMLRAGRRVGTAGAAGAIALVLVVTAQRPDLPRLVEAPDPAGLTLVATVRTDEGILERLSVETGESRVRTISDDELQSLLAGQGVSAGFIRTGGRVILASDLQPEEPANDTSS